MESFNSNQILIDRLLSTPLYKTDGQKTKTVLVTFRHCLSPWTWHIVESEQQEDGDILMFGYVESGLGPECSEWGYTLLSQIAEIPLIVPVIQHDVTITFDGVLHYK